MGEILPAHMFRMLRRTVEIVKAIPELTPASQRVMFEASSDHRTVHLHGDTVYYNPASVIELSNSVLDVLLTGELTNLQHKMITTSPDNTSGA